MKDREGREPFPGDKYRWKGNSRVYELKKANGAGFYFEDVVTKQKAQLKVQTRTLAQMERVK